MSKDLYPIFDFTMVAKNRPLLPDAARIGNPGVEELEELLGLYLAQALEAHYGDRLGWEGLPDDEKALAAFSIPAPPVGTKPLRLGQRAGALAGFVKALRIKIAELNLADNRRGPAVSAADLPLHPSYEAQLRKEFAEHEAFERELRYRAFKARRMSAAA